MCDERDQGEGRDPSPPSMYYKKWGMHNDSPSMTSPTNMSPSTINEENIVVDIIDDTEIKVEKDARYKRGRKSEKERIVSGRTFLYSNTVPVVMEQEF